MDWEKAEKVEIKLYNILGNIKKKKKKSKRTGVENISFRDYANHFRLHEVEYSVEKFKEMEYKTILPRMQARSNS